jgi:hypothetical protein
MQRVAAEETLESGRLISVELHQPGGKKRFSNLQPYPRSRSTSTHGSTTAPSMSRAVDQGAASGSATSSDRHGSSRMYRSRAAKDGVAADLCRERPNRSSRTAARHDVESDRACPGTPMLRHEREAAGYWWMTQRSSPASSHPPDRPYLLVDATSRSGTLAFVSTETVQTSPVRSPTRVSLPKWSR